MNTFQILTAKSRFDLMHWNASIGPDKWPIFGRFLTLFALLPARREEIPPIWRTSVDDVIAWRHCKSSDVTASPPEGELPILTLGQIHTRPLPRYRILCTHIQPLLSGPISSGYSDQPRQTDSHTCSQGSLPHRTTLPLTYRNEVNWLQVHVERSRKSRNYITLRYEITFHQQHGFQITLFAISPCSGYVLTTNELWQIFHSLLSGRNYAGWF
jgi:hypothetical protein